MRLVDAFRSIVEREAMQKPARWAVVYERPDGTQFVGMDWDRHEVERMSRRPGILHRSMGWVPRFILKVTPK